jgi:competence protein ComEA
VLTIIGLAIAVLVAAMAPHGSTHSIARLPLTPTGSPASTGLPASTSGSGIFVHILGEVAAPGLYELHQGDRAVDAVAAAGGFTKKADQSAVNLARFLNDGEQIVVPRIGTPAGQGVSVPGKVNINTADAAALETLAGVGPALAGRILDWRKANGRFAAIEDLLNVTGIGAKTLAGFKDSITL